MREALSGRSDAWSAGTGGATVETMSVATKLAHVATGIHAAIYRASNGKVAGSMGGRQVGLLTTTGSRSGKQRTTPVMTFPHDDGLVIIASNGGSDRMPSWYHNLSANPTVRVQTGAQVRTMTARTASPDEKAQIWPGIVAAASNFGNYQTKTSRDIPVVILTPAGPPGPPGA
jgi:deazaflavin-dependent oxidoreductase (nitroreductase family)